MREARPESVEMKAILMTIFSLTEGRASSSGLFPAEMFSVSFELILPLAEREIKDVSAEDGGFRSLMCCFPLRGAGPL